MLNVERRPLYPEIEPYKTGMLEVSALHTLYYAEYGNPQGKPVVFVHGGPGTGCTHVSPRFHNLEKYRIILFDQRGCGRSTPFLEIRDNTTADLVADMEMLRAHLSVETWQVFGGSWGATLGLAYAQAHAKHVSELIVWGVFLGDAHEVAWLYQEGASRMYPDTFAPYRDFIPQDEQHDLVAAYHKRLTGRDGALKRDAAYHWILWEKTISRLVYDPHNMIHRKDEKAYLAGGCVGNHYMKNSLFLSEGALLAGADVLCDVPGVIVQGRYDTVCPPSAAWALSKAWPTARLEFVEDAGHASLEAGMTDALVRASDSFASV